MFGLPSLFRRHPTAIEVIAEMRDQVIEIGTTVRFLEADRLKPQPRDAAGRYVSSKPDTVAALKAYVDRTTPEQRARETEAFFAAARKGRG